MGKKEKKKKVGEQKALVDIVWKPRDKVKTTFKEKRSFPVWLVAGTFQSRFCFQEQKIRLRAKRLGLTSNVV